MPYALMLLLLYCSPLPQRRLLCHAAAQRQRQQDWCGGMRRISSSSSKHSNSLFGMLHASACLPATCSLVEWSSYIQTIESFRLGHTPFPWNTPPPAHVMVRHKNAPICPFTASPGAKTLCIHQILMWDTVNGGLKPQPWHQNIIQARPNPIFPKTHPHLHTYYSIRMHPYAHPQHLKVLNPFVYIQHRCGMQSMGVFRLNHDTATSCRLDHTPFFQKSLPLHT